jgi:uncharacterized protein
VTRVERDAASAEFFDAAAEGRLLVRRCTGCGAWYPPQQRRCPDGGDVAWAAASGRATLVSWAAEPVRDAWRELAAAGGERCVVALVELEEGPWLHSAMPGVDPAVLRTGLPLTVRFPRIGEGEPVPVFLPE